MTSLAAAGQLQFKPKLGVLYMLAAIFVLGSTDAIVKWSSSNIDPVQIGFSRFVISLIMVLWMLGRSEQGFSVLRTRRPLEHVARAFCSTIELLAYYKAISLIPLPTAMSIVSASPIFGTLLGIVFLRERLRFGGWIAVFAGFAGVLLVVQPEEGANSLFGTVAVLTSVVLWSFA
ncbi:MAG TPA: DMT family transporter, partial [Dongiaceae bacterium]